MAIKFLDRIKNIPTAFQNAMLGTPVQGVQPEASINNAYPQNISDFVSNMKTQEWAQPLFNKNTGYTDNQLVERIGNGLNDGYKQIADFQAQNNIRTPKTGEEINLANVGEFNQYPQIQASIANEPRQGGILRDIATGARENYNEGFSPDNFGQQKNWATRIGEGLGTLARFGDSSLGRGLIAGGLIGALGGTPAEMAAYGLSAGVGRQQNRMKDQLYRNRLEQQGIDTSNISGMLDDNVYKNISIDVYRQKNNDMRQQIADAKDKTSRISLLEKFWEAGADQDFILREMAKYGITVDELGLSNRTRQTTSNINRNDAMIAQGWERIKNDKARIGILKENLQNKINNKNEKDAQKQEYNEDLLEFVEIATGKDRKAEDYARKVFIRKHGKDPYKSIEL